MELNHYTDQKIVQAILRRDTFITKEYLYRKCYPLFKAVYDKYYTDCEMLMGLSIISNLQKYNARLDTLAKSVSDNLLSTISLS